MLPYILKRIEKSWYQDKWWNVWLLPLSGLFFVISHLRRLWLTKVSVAAKVTKIPVVIVGNINVGGTGKTPLVCYLVERLAKDGIKVGIISRGYGSDAPQYPYSVGIGERASTVGDEPKLLRDRLNCPVVIGPDRNAAISLLSQQDVDLIISDDGLQHYKMARDYEVVVLDSSRGIGNGWLMPAGPLREGAWRLKTINLPIYNGSSMNIVPTAWVNAKTGERKDLSFFSHKKVHAVAGIGNPQRFYNTLEELNVKSINHGFPDHHKFVSEDLDLQDDFSADIVMTEKDWVKCQSFALESMWYLEVGAALDSDLEGKLINDLKVIVSK